MNRGSSPAATTRTGCCSTPIGTGASTPPARARCVPWPTSVRTGSTSCGSSPAGGSIAVLADLHTFVPERNHPDGEVETFGAAGVDHDVARVREHMTGDDAAGRAAALRGRDARDVHGEPGLGRSQEHDRLGDRRVAARARLELRGSRAALGRSPRPSERGDREGRRDHDACRHRGRRVSGGARRGVPRHVPRPVRRRVSRRRRRWSVGVPGVPDVRRRPRRHGSVRCDQRIGPHRHVGHRRSCPCRNQP